MKIFLLGLPGSGKSTIGKRLAEVLKYHFIDTDDEIIRTEKRSIEDIFLKEGEPYFREKEHRMLKEVAAVEDAVVSTGGGTPCFFDNMDIINAHGISIFFNIPIDTIVFRLRKGRNKNRPMVAGKSDQQLLEFLHAKYTERQPYYSQATFEISSPNISAEMVVEELRKRDLLKEIQ